MRMLIIIFLLLINLISAQTLQAVFESKRANYAKQ